MDDADPLAAFRDRFVTADAVVYLDGNSLGRPPRPPSSGCALRRGGVGRPADPRLGRAVVRPAADPRRRLGRGRLGAAPGQMTVGDSTTVLLYKLAARRGCRAPRPYQIVIDRDHFPTDRYLAGGLAGSAG